MEKPALDAPQSGIERGAVAGTPPQAGFTRNVVALIDAVKRQRTENPQKARILLGYRPSGRVDGYAERGAKFAPERGANRSALKEKVMDNGNRAHMPEPAGAAPSPLQRQYVELFSPQPGAVRSGGRFEVFTLTDYSIPVRMTNSTGPLEQ